MRLLILFSLAFFMSCGLTSDGGDDSSSGISQETTFANNLATISTKRGIVGFYDVPEMLVLAVQDSAAAAEVAKRVEYAYMMLENDIAFTRSVRNGAYGQITYNNDTSNFKFECFALIRQIPAKNPRHARVVVLEADHMLAYNYFGPYNMLYTGYAEIREYLEKKRLDQTGPMREYYVTDPRLQPDESKLRTLIMVPVRRKKETDGR